VTLIRYHTHDCPCCRDEFECNDKHPPWKDWHGLLLELSEITVYCEWCTEECTDGHKRKET